MTQVSDQWRPGERPDQPPTHPYDPDNQDQRPDQQRGPEPLPLPPDGEPQPAPIREPSEPMPAIDPEPAAPPIIA